MKTITVTDVQYKVRRTIPAANIRDIQEVLPTSQVYLNEHARCFVFLKGGKEAPVYCVEETLDELRTQLDT